MENLTHQMSRELLLRKEGRGSDRHTLLADRGGFWMADWHKVPPRPEHRRLVGVEMVEVALNCGDGGRKHDMECSQN